MHALTVLFASLPLLAGLASAQGIPAGGICCTGEIQDPSKSCSGKAFCCDDTSTQTNSQTDHPGVYVISISINGRDGKFLNFFELNVTATFIEEYIEASELFSRCGKAKFTAAEKEKMAQSTRVDTAYGVLLVKSKTRFIDSASSVDELREIANGLHRRMITPSLGQNRAHEYQIQSPQYIGCSTRLSRRLKDYDVATGLKSVNKPLAFLLHVLEALGHRPVLTRRVVAKV
ncbi:hypothetical protein LY78DRAFT_709213 [Colletotrichum sublineola]|nr:hypothetical protein LY78DRAFT_709213 [Colletotrichum sublineola]